MKRQADNLSVAVRKIKTAILRSRYMAMRLANVEMLKLYMGIGGYVSMNSRKGAWGTGAIESISNRLQQELPGLRGFAPSSIKRMRTFFEAWVPASNRPLPMGDLETDSQSLCLVGEFRPSVMGEMSECDFAAFCAVPFTLHSLIIEKCKSQEERWYYIRRAAAEFWSVTALRSHLKSGDYRRRGKLPNNFAVSIPSSELATKAANVFHDEVFLEGINVGEDEGDVDERLLETALVANIRKFMLSLGPDFCFMGEQFRMIVEGEEQFIDLLFYHRELKCLIAIELKGGKFKPAYLGQLNFYLTALDDKVRKPSENPSVGIVLCREFNKAFVEMAIRDMSKPMGVAVFKSDRTVPRAYRALTPLMNELPQLLNADKPVRPSPAKPKSRSGKGSEDRT